MAKLLLLYAAVWDAHERPCCRPRRDRPPPCKRRSGKKANKFFENEWPALKQEKKKVQRARDAAAPGPFTLAGLTKKTGRRAADPLDGVDLCFFPALK